LDPTRADAGQDRILKLLESRGANVYVNAPGGAALYDDRAFAKAGVELAFLTPYRGDQSSILQRLSDEPASVLREEIVSQLATLSQEALKRTLSS
jgi:hypothetical protein